MSVFVFTILLKIILRTQIDRRIVIDYFIFDSVKNFLTFPHYEFKMHFVRRFTTKPSRNEVIPYLHLCKELLEGSLRPLLISDTRGDE